MKIEVDQKTEELIQEELKAGHFKSASALVHEAVRQLVEKEFEPLEHYTREEIEEKIERGLREADEGKTISSEQFFAELRRRRKECIDLKLSRDGYGAGYHLVKK